FATLLLRSSRHYRCRHSRRASARGRRFLVRGPLPRPGSRTSARTGSRDGRARRFPGLPSRDTWWLATRRRRRNDRDRRLECFEVLGALATRSRVDKIGNGRASPWRFDQRRGLCEERRRRLRRPRAREWTPGSGGVAARSYFLPIPPKQFVHAERDIGAHSEE